MMIMAGAGATIDPVTDMTGQILFAIPAIFFLLVAMAEIFAPRHRPVTERIRRWPAHFLFFLTNIATGRILARLVAVGGAAYWAQQADFGLFNIIEADGWIIWLSAFIILDFAVWLQHLLLHKIPLFWRAHSVHHSDRDLDVTTALRFHPFELLVSTMYKSAWVALLGVPPVTALAFEGWLNANAMFNHGNINLPRRVDWIIRPILVTPDMHLVHHSIDADEQNHNYGFALSIWDRIFGTYIARSRHGREEQPIGMSGIRDDRANRFLWIMKQPLLRKPPS